MKPDTNGAGEASFRVIPSDWRERIEASLRVQQYAFRTEQTYLGWLSCYVDFCGNRNDGPCVKDGDPRAFLESLAVESNVSAGTQNQAHSAILYFYRTLWKSDLDNLEGTIRARRSRTLPTVLSVEEIRRVLRGMEGSVRVAADLLYGCGLRVTECLRLRVKDIDFNRQSVEVRQGKGRKDRLVMLPDATVPALQEHLERVRQMWEFDRKEGLPGVEMPDALDRKMPRAGETWPWHWVFPSKKISRDARSGIVRRHHRHPSALQKAIRRAAKAAEISRRLSHAATQFRHPPVGRWSGYSDGPGTSRSQSSV